MEFEWIGEQVSDYSAHLLMINRGFLRWVWRKSGLRNKYREFDYIVETEHTATSTSIIYIYTSLTLSPDITLAIRIRPYKQKKKKTYKFLDIRLKEQLHITKQYHLCFLEKQQIFKEHLQSYLVQYIQKYCMRYAKLI